jgi:hypothetical protein
MKLLAYFLIGLAVIGSGFVLLMAVSMFFLFPMELSDKLAFGTVCLAVSGVLTFVAHKLYIRFVRPHED